MLWPLRLFGVPLHPLLVHFPVAFWLCVPVLDAAALVSDASPWWTLALSATAIGVVIGVPAIVAGLLEYAHLSGAGVAVRLAARHGVRTGMAWCLFTAKLVIAAVATRSAVITAICFALDVLACALLVQGAFFGTRLIYQHMGGGNDPV